MSARVALLEETGRTPMFLHKSLRRTESNLRSWIQAIVGVAWLLGSATTFTACLPRMVVVNGTEMPYDEGAETVLRQGQQALERGDKITAETRFKEVLQLFGDSELVPYALDGLAKMAHDEGGCTASARYDRRLLSDFRRHQGAQAATARQADCGGVATTTPVSSSQFDDQYEQAGSDAEQREVASTAADTAMRDGDYLQAVQWLLRVREHESDPAQRQAVETEIIELVDGKLSATELRIFADTLSGSGFPAARVNAKLALLLEHAGDADNARSTLERYIRTWPDSEFTPIAQARLERLTAQDKVQPGTIGVLLPLSGRHKAFGNLALQAIKLGLGIRGKSMTTSDGVRLVLADTKSDAVTAANAVDDLVVRHGVQAILGPIFTYEAEPAAFRAQALAVPLLTISRAERLPDIGPYVFRNGVTTEDQVEALVSHAMGVMGMRTFAILYPRHPYGEDLMHKFWDEVEKRGGEIRGVEAYDVNATTFTNQVKRLVGRKDLELRADYRRGREDCEKQPDVYRQQRCRNNLAKELRPIIDFEGLFIPHYPPTISMVSAALAAEDIIVEQDPRRLRIIEKTIGRKVKPVTLLGADGWNSSKVLERSGRNVENAVFTDGFFADAAEKEAAEFVLAYRKRYRRTPRLYPEALFFDSARILGAVMAQRPSSRDAIRQALQQVSNFRGVTGPTTFAGSNIAQRQIRILTIKDGKIESVPPVDPNARRPGAPKTN